MTRLRPLLFVALLLWAPASLLAQDEPAGDSPAFSLWSSEIYTTTERPSFHLTYRQVDHLDFRVYKVQDPLAFFAGLKDPHALGSEKPVVPQERTWLERIASWKSGQRARIRGFLRNQVSWEYRVHRREASDQVQVAQRQVLRHNTFAQVPLLNASSVVASWRELLPPLREADTRRIPLDVKEPGVYVVEAISAPLKAYTIVMVSDVGLVTKTSPGQILVYAAHRATGQPQSGCDIQTLVNNTVAATGKTGDDGVAISTFTVDRPDSVVTVARCGNQVTASDPGNWALQSDAREMVGYIYTDKPVYRPGHTVRIKGVLRWRAQGQLLPFDGNEVELSITDSNDKVVRRETRPVDAFGAVSTSFTVPAGASLGYYTIKVAKGEAEASSSFQVQEYRKPEFEVIVTPAERFVTQGGRASVTINAKYYFGQPVARGSVKYAIHRQGFYSPWRWGEVDDEEGGGGYFWGGEQAEEQTAELDADGNATLAIPLELDENSRDYSIRIEARVTDASSREVSGNTVVHAPFGPFMVNASPDRYVYRAGSEASVSIKALDYLGAVRPNVTLQVALERLVYSQGRWSDPTVTTITQGTATTDADGRASWTTTLPKDSTGSLQFKVVAQVDGRAIADTASLWVTNASNTSYHEDNTYLELIADQRSYKPGDTARLVVKGGKVTAPVLVTKEGQSISYHKVVTVAGDEAIEVPVSEADLGDIYVNIVFLRDDRLFRAEKRIKVPALSRQLNVQVTAEQPVAKPRQSGKFLLTVTDAAGVPVKAQLSVGVIDEAVYGVQPDGTVDPVRFFYRLSYSRVYTDFSRDYSFVGYAGTQQLLLTQRRRPLTLADFKADKPARPQVRKEFPDAIYWAADITTDAAGKASVDVPYPDALTTWRLTARAVTADTLTGTGVARTLTTKDLILRAVTPRFLTEGDTLNLPYIVHNYLPGEQTVTLSGTAAGVTPDPNGALAQPIQFAVPQNGEHRVDWTLKANAVGTATVGGSVTAPTDGDALELSFPVLAFGLKRESGIAGSIVGGGEQSGELVLPATANPAARTVRVQIAPSLAGPMLGALEFLSSYPYGCTEQTLSSFVPNLLVQRALADLKLPPTERLKSLDRQVSDGLKRIYDYQHEDGGWGWWKTDENQPFMTAYAVYGLLEAKNTGYRVDEYRLEQGARQLKKLYAKYPKAVPELKAYITHVLVLAETRGVEATDYSDDPRWERDAALNELWAAKDRMSSYGQALLLLALNDRKDARGDELARQLLGGVQRKGELAWWKADNDPLLDDWADTSVEATAMAVRALAGREAKNPVLEQAVRWMLLNRTFGWYWGSTKQTAMALYGLLDYMKARGETAADSEVTVFVNGASVGTTKLTGAALTAPDPIEFTVAARDGQNAVKVVTRGAGAVYWAAQAVYYDTAAAQERTGSRKLALERQYFTLTPVTVKDRIVYRETPFTGTANPGDILLVRLTTAGSADWRYLMIEDPLPAGVEPIQQERFYAMERQRQDMWYWGSQREFRDDRVVFFQQSFNRGRYEFQYLVKVVSPGTFRRTPARITARYGRKGPAASAARPVCNPPPTAAPSSNGGRQ